MHNFTYLHTRHGLQKQQKGIATVLVVVLVGLALTATSLGIMHSIRNTQEKHVAVNAVTHAQTGVWAGAEAFRRYLIELDETTLEGLTGELTIGLPSEYGSIVAKNITSTATGSGGFRVTADIVNVHDAARSSAALGVAYETTAAGCSPCSPTVDSVNFNDDLNISGGIELWGDTGQSIDLNVNGNVNIGGVNINPLEAINATGTVTIGSDVVANSIYANDDVTLYGTDVTTVVTLGDFYANGDAAVDTLRANGSVIIEASGRFESVNAVNDITVRMSGASGHGFMKAGGQFTANAAKIDRVEAVGNVTINTWEYITEVISEGNISCVGNTWLNTDLISANGSLINCAAENASNPKIEDNAANNVVPIDPEVAFSMSAAVIDVWTLKSQANYIIEKDEYDRVIVTVNNVAGIADGSEYIIASYPGGYGGSYYSHYLCETTSSTDSWANCTAPVDPLIPICLGSSLSNGCISYNTWTNSFNVNPNFTAPGIMFFDGDVELGNGAGVTTILASGNVKTYGSFKTDSVNYGGYDKVCLADASHVTNSDAGIQAQLRARYTAEYSVHYPTNLCSGGAYTALQVGNVGIAAGGIDPSGDGSYSGGDINLGALTEITGAVLSGNILKTGGDVTIYGVVSATSLKQQGVEDNTLTGKTTIDLRRSSENYNPQDVPFLDTSSESTSSTATSKLLWARYL